MIAGTACTWIAHERTSRQQYPPASLPARPSARQSTTVAVDLLQRHHSCVVIPQTVYEYWVVATRSLDSNGLGFAPAFAALERDRFLELFNLLRDERSIFEQWVSLMDDYQVKGIKAHDARYVAAMKRHGMTHLLTFNDRDFRRYDSITVYTPVQIVDEHQANPTFLQSWPEKAL